ncbi:protein of unknown function [Nannocystis exedens]|uniref:PatA-like N-terminal domain-containing protein n=1 Tax=Nannocystis exedens TaxID=54 RepID=A0A1I2AEJ2_9BACT|nr:DUF4388 domain-containing protein [Nannocystis exedens]PCC69800.1 hypothetical protein NAEX_02826 [Nannocystis exedens]SFE42425.1 protein of unknown function [Nannocystis exedens]
MRKPQDDLVFIDERGVAQPHGEHAGEQMRARAGAYRLMPTPNHVVFMRYTGQDGRRDEEDGAIVRLAGEITHPGTMCDVIALIAQANWRGELTVRDGEHVRSIFIDSGNAVCATSDVDEERFGKIMYRFGAIDEFQLRHTLDKQKESGLRFGDMAVELGISNHSQVYQYLGKQAEEIVLASMQVSDGMFCFLDGFDDEAIPFHHSLNLNNLLMDGVTRMDEMRYFRQRVPSGDYVPDRVEGRTDPPKEFRAIYDAIDGVLSVIELGRVLGLGEFQTTKQLFQLIQSKHVTMQKPRMRGGPLEVVETANAVLQQIHQEADSGGKGTILRNNLASFVDPTYEQLFSRAGPAEKGAFEAQRVVDNARILFAGANIERQLKELLYDYVSFALFTAGSLVRRSKDQSLSKQVEPLMSRLRPIG